MLQQVMYGITDLNVQDDLVTVVSREEPLHIGCSTGGTAQGVETPSGVHVQENWHCGCMCLY